MRRLRKMSSLRELFNVSVRNNQETPNLGVFLSIYPHLKVGSEWCKMETRWGNVDNYGENSKNMWITPQKACL